MNCLTQPSIRLCRSSTPSKKSGQIQMICGPMFSGKSTLSFTLSLFQSLFLTLSFSLSLSHSLFLTLSFSISLSHSLFHTLSFSLSLSHSLFFTLSFSLSTTKLFNLAKNIEGAGYDVIGNDEGQFFPVFVGFIKNVCKDVSFIYVEMWQVHKNLQNKRWSWPRCTKRIGIDYQTLSPRRKNFLGRLKLLDKAFIIVENDKNSEKNYFPILLHAIFLMTQKHYQRKN
jgi:hypothetical protein